LSADEEESLADPHEDILALFAPIAERAFDAIEQLRSTLCAGCGATREAQQLAGIGEALRLYHRSVMIAGGPPARRKCSNPCPK